MSLLDNERLPRHSPVRACLQRSERTPARSTGLLVREDGSIRWIEDTVAPIVEAGLVTGAVWVCKDVTEQRMVVEWVEQHLQLDAVTGLKNRREFERLLATPGVGARGAAGGLLCHIDIDQFRVVNDTAGHVAGDALVVEIAELLKDGIRETDVLARVGGDEFGLLLSGCSAEDGVARCNALRERIAAFRFRWQGQLHAVTVSIGIAPLPGRGGPALFALTQADLACQAAKDAGRNRVHFAAESDQLVESRLGQMQWVSQLRRAVADDRIELFIQPIVAVTAPRAPPVHGEVLVRLRGEDGVLVSPALFIPAAERYNLMGVIDHHVIDKALAWMRKTPGVHCSINVSGQSLGDASFMGSVTALMAEHAVDARRVCFEVTETAAIANLAAAQRFIAAFRQRGARFALDDFGAGLSSFAYLRNLQVDVVKIDGAFVKTMHTDPQNHAIVESIHRVARACKLSTVAEWVENEDILQALATIGVDHAQGYGVGKPMPVAAWPGR